MNEIRCANRESVAPTATHDVALDCLIAGIEAGHPVNRVRETIAVEANKLQIEGADGSTGEYDLDWYDEIVLVGGGNASGHFAAAIEDELGEWLTGGAVVTDDPVETTTVDVLPGAHPVPSQAGVESTRHVLDIVDEAGDDDLVLAAITGGGSALLGAPAGSLTLSDLRAVTEELLACGASIDEINAVRKHCSAIKGGQLARAGAPATVVTVVLSDVVGDDLSVIASGPTVPDPSTYVDALAVIDRYDLDIPESVRAHLQAGADGDRAETPTAAESLFDRTRAYVLGSGRTALDAARETARERGYTAEILASGVRGEASESARTHVAIAAECQERGSPIAPPAVVLSGGETTVTLGDDHGAGGPNQEFALSAALDLERDGIVVASVDTDGIDGVTDAAGAIVDGSTVPEEAGRRALDRNDALPVLDDANAVISTGPTGTNVNDLRVMVVEETE